MVDGVVIVNSGETEQSSEVSTAVEAAIETAIEEVTEEVVELVEEITDTVVESNEDIRSWITQEIGETRSELATMRETMEAMGATLLLLIPPASEPIVEEPMEEALIVEPEMTTLETNEEILPTAQREDPESAVESGQAELNRETREIIKI